MCFGRMGDGACLVWAGHLCCVHMVIVLTVEVGDAQRMSQSTSYFLIGGGGVKQKIFLSFLNNFHKSAQASPLFDGTMTGTTIANLYPNMLVGLVVP